jgi:hypothetical protein
MHFISEKLFMTCEHLQSYYPPHHIPCFVKQSTASTGDTHLHFGADAANNEVELTATADTITVATITITFDSIRRYHFTTNYVAITVIGVDTAITTVATVAAVEEEEVVEWAPARAVIQLNLYPFAL